MTRQIDQEGTGENKTKMVGHCGERASAVFGRFRQVQSPLFPRGLCALGGSRNGQRNERMDGRGITAMKRAMTRRSMISRRLIFVKRKQENTGLRKGKEIDKKEETKAG